MLLSQRELVPAVAEIAATATHTLAWKACVEKPRRPISPLAAPLVTTALSLLIPVFALIGLGRAAVGAGFLHSDGAKGLNDFALWLALPALLFRSIIESDSLQALNIAWVYLTGCLIVYVVAGAIAHFVLRRDLAEAAAFALNATYGNVIYLGVPVVTAAFGTNGVTLILAIIALHSGVLLPLTSILVQLGTHGDRGFRTMVTGAALGVLRNPIVMSIVTGAVGHFLGLRLPAALDKLLVQLGVAAAPLALFCVGAALPAVNGKLVSREAIIIAILKLGILPVVIGTLVLAAGMYGLPLVVAVTTASMPTGANAFLLSRRTAGFAAASASVVVITTGASLATLSCFLAWIR